MSADVLSLTEARTYLVGQAGLRTYTRQSVPKLLNQRRCIQLDPLQPIGTNADLVALARLNGIQRGDVYSDLLPGHAFEHFSKERCLIPADRFPLWRDEAAGNPRIRQTARMKQLSEDVLNDVVSEVRERGPIAVADLTDRGRVTPLDYSGWKGTANRTTLAFEVLWRRCSVVVTGRQGKGKVIDVPERALPEHHDAPANGPFDRIVLIDRVEAAGLLSEVSGPHWSMLADARKSDLPNQLIEDGILERVRLEGARRTYLAPAGFRDRTYPNDDGNLRILGPLDPMLWDRKLVQQVFDFEYVWEVYKPAAKRRWGWYVVPLLHHGRLVGRLEARAADGVLVVANVWDEGGLDGDALRAALTRHAQALGVEPPVR